MGKKETSYSDIKNYIEVVSKSNCTLITTEEEFEKEKILQNKRNGLTKIRIVCGICREEFVTDFASFKNKNKIQCTACGKRNNIDKQSFTYEYIKEYIEINSDCKIITSKEEFEFEKIKQNKSSVLVKIRLLCEKCKNEIYLISFDNFKFKNKKTCNSCSIQNAKDKMSFQYEDIKKYIEVDSNSNCRLVTNKEEFELDKIKQGKSSVNVRVKILCGSCKTNTFETSFSKFKYRNKIECNECRGVTIITIDTAKKFFIEKGLIPMFNEYINFDTPLDCRDKEGYLYKLSLNCLLQEYGHSKFTSRNPYTIQNINLWLNLNNINYKLLSNKYIDINKRLKWICDKGHIYEANLNNFYHNNRRCPICNESKGESKINEYLIKNNFIKDKDYISQKEFKELIGLRGGNLSYDFYLPQYNLLIEYQGEQHESYIKGLHISKKNFERQQEHDRRKREYAENHKINLLEIWYWDYDNIEKILKENKII